MTVVRIRRAERAAVGAAPVETVEIGRFVERQCQEIGEPRRALQRRPTIAPLRHVMGQAGNGYAGKARHDGGIAGSR